MATLHSDHNAPSLTTIYPSPPIIKPSFPIISHHSPIRLRTIVHHKLQLSIIKPAIKKHDISHDQAIIKPSLDPSLTMSSHHEPAPIHRSPGASWWCFTGWTTAPFVALRAWPSPGRNCRGRWWCHGSTGCGEQMVCMTMVCECYDNLWLMMVYELYVR